MNGPSAGCKGYRRRMRMRGRLPSSSRYPRLSPPIPVHFFFISERGTCVNFISRIRKPQNAGRGFVSGGGGQFGRWCGLAREWSACRVRWRRRSRRPCEIRGALRGRPDRAFARSSDLPLEGSRPQGAISRPTPRLLCLVLRLQRGEGCTDV